MPNTEPAATETVVEETTVEQTPTSTTETTTESVSGLSDGDVERISESVFQKMKSFTESLTAASQAAVEIAADMLPIDNAPAPAGADVAPEAPPEPDYKPERRHRLFGQPLKRG